jgi:SRSO17 transposase
LYLPQSWMADFDRRREAEVPDVVPFATQLQLAQCMLAWALAACVRVPWVMDDEVHGSDPD